MCTSCDLERHKLYLAAPLFSDAERRFNLDLANLLADTFEVYLPQRDGGTVDRLLGQGNSAGDAKSIVFSRDMDALEDCDTFVAVLDGRTIDEGVAFELGFAFARGKYCIGLQTDFRRFGPAGNNAMIDSALEIIFQSVQDLLTWASCFRANLGPAPTTTVNLSVSAMRVRSEDTPLDSADSIGGLLPSHVLPASASLRQSELHPRRLRGGAPIPATAD